MLLNNRYQRQDPIGRGGMAAVYRGYDQLLERFIALKVLRDIYSTDPKLVTNFHREARITASLQHPNIAQVYDYGHSEGYYFIVRELVEGTDLRRYLRSRGVLVVDRAIMIAHEVALALGAAHQHGIVHCSIKLHNILIGRDGFIKLIDFGNAYNMNDSLNAEGITFEGPDCYVPEQAQSTIKTPAADIYALGILMYIMLTERIPFDGDTPVAVAMQHIHDAPTPPSQLNPDIPPTLEAIILRCLEKKPEMRYRDGTELAHALETLNVT